MPHIVQISSFCFSSQDCVLHISWFIMDRPRETHRRNCIVLSWLFRFPPTQHKFRCTPGQFPPDISAAKPWGGWFYILISGDCPPLAAQGVAHCIRPSVSRICNERESERLREDRKRDSNAKQDGRTEDSSKVAIERLWGKVERGRFVSNERAGSVRQRDSDCAAVGGLQLARMRGRSWDAL